ncbi:MAG: hypothetical protein NC930_02760 [Candidatus Omnitrophica bacterium]|nr:hypothetical protein [Candidatus Omnitrophota bacterium]
MINKVDMTNPTKEFQFSHQGLDRTEEIRERVFSILPGFMSWTILIVMIVLSFAKPLWAAVIIIAFDLYWLFRLFYMTIFLVLAYGVLAIEKETDWTELCCLLEKGRSGVETFRRKQKNLGPRDRIKRWFWFKNKERELQHVIRQGVKVPSYESLYHLVIIAVSNEQRSIIEPGLKALTESRFPPKRLIPVLAVEERFGEKQTEMAEVLQFQYRHHFFDFLVTIHPSNIPGEARVKGANVTYAAKQAAQFFRTHNIPFENVIVSCFDADTVADSQYFAALTFHFMRHPDRMRASYQPIPVYHNNIWEAPGFARVLELGSSFFQLIEATNPEKLVTFSSHSMSFKALDEVGYWPVDMISDDSAIYW